MVNMATSAIVTGYSSGLCAEFAKLLLEQGWSVVGVSRQSERETLHERFGKRLAVVHGSVDKQVVADAAFAAAHDLGDLRLVINCAGVGVFGEIGGYSADEIVATMSGNLLGLILFSDLAVRHLRDRGGDIVNVMSTAGKKLRTGESVYVGAKWGAKGYTRTLRDAIKAAKLPIRVFEVYPCGMNTPFWASATRPVTDGLAFPPPDPIAEQVIQEINARRSVYCQEFTFERS
jgi:NAD(P)-dependent dehydrogenase (short-subunit alcohol dehydrogenase family)